MKRKDLPEDYPSSYLCGSCLNCLVGYKSFWDSRKPSEWLRWITNIQSGIWWINKRQKQTQNSVDHFLVFAISSNVKSYFKAFSQVGTHNGNHHNKGLTSKQKCQDCAHLLALFIQTIIWKAFPPERALDTDTPRGFLYDVSSNTSALFNPRPHYCQGRQEHRLRLRSPHRAVVSVARALEADRCLRCSRRAVKWPPKSSAGCSILTATGCCQGTRARYSRHTRETSRSVAGALSGITHAACACVLTIWESHDQTIGQVRYTHAHTHTTNAHKG